MLRELFTKYETLKDKDITSHYVNIYENWFRKDRYKITSILEIGIYKGGSLNAWADFFPYAEIYGIDKTKRKWEIISDRIHPIIGDQSDKGFLESTFKDSKFDIIIDDGSHIMKHQQKSFNVLFKYLKPGGVYVIEDLHTSYWPKFNGKFRGKKTTIEKLKSYVDHLNYWAYKESKRAKEYKSNEPVDFLDNEIESIHFYKSMCFIRRHK